MEGGRNNFPYSKISIRSREGIRSLQNHNSANTTLIIVADKIHQWLLKSVGESFRRNMIFVVLRISPKIFINNKGKDKNFSLEKPSRHRLNQAMRVTITSNSHKPCQHHELSDTRP